MNVTGVFAQDSSPISLGVGGFGAGGGDAGTVSVNRGAAGDAAGAIATDGQGAIAIEASSIGGGGVGGALSRSFLRIFEDFPYTRLGIRCRLANGTCDMGGVEAAPNGYYIVKGRLLPPRLDVIGYADRVNWNSLVAQLVAVTGRQGAVVE